jgi:hypothetical protein
LGIDDKFSTLELLVQTGVVTLQLLDLSCRGIRLVVSLGWLEMRVA